MPTLLGTTLLAPFHDPVPSSFLVDEVTPITMRAVQTEIRHKEDLGLRPNKISHEDPSIDLFQKIR